MLLSLIGGSLIGAALGTATAIIPGLSSVHTAIASGLVGLVNPVMGAACHITSHVVNNFLSSAKEALDPTTSGSAEMIATAQDEESIIDPMQQCHSLFFAKGAGAALGVAAGVFLGGVLLPFTGIPSLVMWVAGLILLLMWSSFRRHWLLILGVFLGSQFLFTQAPLWGITNIVFCLGSALWIIPACLEAMSKNRSEINNSKFNWEGCSKGINLPDPVKFVLGSLLAIATPGVSPALLITATTRKGNQLSQLTLAAAEMFVTTYALVGWLFGTLSGKSALLIELGALGLAPGLWMFVLFIGAAAFSLFVLPYVYGAVRGLVTLPGVHLLSLIIAVATLVVSAGAVAGTLLIAVGLGLHYAMKACGCPQTIKALVWLAPVL